MADVYQTSGREIQVETDDETFQLLYNPETRYVLIPADIYGSNKEVVDALRSSSEVDGIFNHEQIGTVTY